MTSQHIPVCHPERTRSFALLLAWWALRLSCLILCLEAPLLRADVPIITCPANISTSAAPGQCNAAVVFTATATEGTVTCVPASGSVFAAGVTTVECAAVNGDGSANCSFTVTVLDTQAPAISCSTNIVVECTSPAGALVSFSTTASDNCDSNPTIICSPASGSIFGLGTTPVNCRAFDSSHNTNVCSFLVRVADTLPPALSCSTNIVAESTTPAGAVVNFAVSALDVCDGSPEAFCVPPAGSTFSLGATTVNCEAWDISHNTNRCRFTITVRDTTPPTLSCSTNRFVEPTGPSGATVNFSTTASDAGDANPVVTCTPATGSLFAAGTTTVNCQAVDASNNSSSCSFTVTVADHTGPAIVCSTNRLVQASGPAGASVTFVVTATDVFDLNPTVICSPASGFSFGLGATTVNCRAFDTEHNTNTCSFTVTVVDTSAPVLGCSTNIIAEATSAAGAAVTFAITAFDIFDPTPSLVCVPASGSTFSKGVSTVSCQAVDNQHNTNTCSFTVTVRDTTAPVISCSTNVIAEGTSTSGALVAFTVSATDAVDPSPVINCVPASGSLFALGTTTVNCQAQDANLNVRTCSFLVNVVDRTAPVISCSSNRTVEATSAAGAAVTFVTTATDLCDAHPGVVCVPPSGSTFVQGATVVNCRAGDASLNTNTCSFTVTVTETTAPVISCSTNVVTEGTGPNGAVVLFTTTAVDVGDPNPTVTCVPASGSTFALGTTTVSCMARDAHGNTNGCTFTVTVLDRTLPVISCSTNIVAECAGGIGAVVNYTSTALDLCDPNPTVICQPPSGSIFGMGLTTIQCRAFDFSHNTNTCTFTVRVSDTTAPALSCSTNIVAESATPAGAVVTFSVAAFDLCDGSPALSCVPASGTVFAPGLTTVNCEAIDLSNNTNRCRFTVTVLDKTAPVLVCSTNIMTEATGAAGATVSFSVTATDLADAHPVVTCTPASGSVFGLGTTTVQCDATDASNNHSTCNFTVTVRDTSGPLIVCSTNIVRESTGPGPMAVAYVVTASDANDASPTVVCSPASGSLFNPGTTTVACRAFDLHNNTNTCSFTVTVSDTTAPTIACSSNLQLEGTSAAGAVATFAITATDLVDPAPAVICTPASGTTFPLGLTTVTCRATDVSHNERQCSFTVTVVDTTIPVLTCSTNITVECAGAPGTLVNFTSTRSDICDPNPGLVCTPASGSIFKLGATTVSCVATDASGNTNRCTFSVSVVDTMGPVISCSTNVVAEFTTSTGAVVNYQVTADDNCDTNRVLTCSPASGSLFGPGLTLVQCVAYDTAHNTNRCSFTVTVVDTAAPVLICPTNSVLDATSSAGAVATYQPQVSDVRDASPVVVCTPASGTTLALGVHTVNCVARDASNNTNTCQFTITVVDRTAPSLTCSPNLNVPCAGRAGTVVTYSVSATDVADPGVVAVCTPASGSRFEPGITAVLCQAVDLSHNTNTCTFNVTVSDTTPPVISCPTNQVVVAVSGQEGAIVSYTVAATDNCVSNVTVVCAPPSGAPFPLGITTVNCAATDSVGNSSTCNFKVTVAQAFIVTKSLAATRNDFTGMVGMKVTIGVEDVVVTHLGRIMAPGNSANHVLKIYRVSDALEVANSAVQVSMAAGTVGQFVYAALANPVTLRSNTSYYVVSDEVVNGDRWHTIDTVVTTTSAGTADTGAFVGGGYPWQTQGLGGHVYGPVDFLYARTASASLPVVNLTGPLDGDAYTAPANITLQATATLTVTNVQFYVGSIMLGEDRQAPYSLIWSNVMAGSYALSVRGMSSDGLSVTSRVANISVVTNVPGSETEFLLSKALHSMRNDYSGYLGTRITVGSTPITVTALGRLFATGNNRTHHVKVVRASDQSDMPNGSVMLSMVGGVAGQFKYAVLADPITLAANASYFIVSEETATGDNWYDIDTIVTSKSVALVDGGIYSPNGSTYTLTGTTNQMYVPVDFRYVSGTVVAGMTLAITSPVDGAVFSAPTNVVIEAAGSAAITNVVFLVGTNVIGSDSTSPFTATLINPPLGNFALSAIGLGTNGLMTTSAVVTVTISTNVPVATVALTRPIEGEIFLAPANVVLDAVASAGVTNVAFFVNGSKVSEDNVAPFSLIYTNVLPGLYSLQAVGMANTGLSTTSAVVQVSVSTNIPGVETAFVTSKSPQQARNDFNGFLGMEITVGPNPITVTKLGRLVIAGNSMPHLLKFIRRSDKSEVPGGAVTVSLAGGTANQFKYEPLANPISLAAHEGYYLVSQETSGGDQWYDVARTVVTGNPVATIDGGVFGGPPWGTGGLTNHSYIPVDFTYIPGAPTPTVALTAPVEGSTFLAPTNLTVAASASAGVVLMQFYAGTTKIGQDATEPYSIVWTNAPVGNQALSAIASISGGNFVTSSVVNVIVTSDVPAPAVTITSPVDLAGYIAPSSIPIEVTTSLGITNVEFRAGATVLGRTDVNPFTFSWTNAQPGNYALTAVGRARSGTMGTSAVVNVTISTNIPITESAYIVTADARDMRNDIDGFLGMEVTVGANPITVTKLGRYVTPGSSLSHVVKLVTEIDGVDVPNGAVTISMAGATAGQFKYATLASPITLNANTIYFLVSSETRGGDLWADVSRTVLTTMPVGSVDAGVFGGPPWTAGGLPNHGYGPVDFVYQTGGGPLKPSVAITSPSEGSSFLAPANITIEAPAIGGVTKVEFYRGTTKLGEDTTTPYNYTWITPAPGEYELTARAYANNGLISTSAIVDVTITTNLLGTDSPFVVSRTPGTLRHNFNGYVGLAVTVGARPLTVTALGREYIAGNSLSHLLKLVRASDGVDVVNGSATVSMAGGTAGHFRYANLANPVTLQANTLYYALSSEIVDGDVWYDFDTVVSTTSVGSADSGAFRATGSPYAVAGGPNSAFGPVNFRYRTPAVSIASPGEGAVINVPTNITIEALASLSVTNVEFFQGTTKLGQDSSAPYQFNWINPVAGIYELSARAVDSLGLMATSSVVHVTLRTNTPPPTVAITSPASGTILIGPADITVAASASATVTNVDFYAGLSKIGSDSAAPFELVWANVPPGEYQLTARAQSSAGLNATSSVVSVTIRTNTATDAALIQQVFTSAGPRNNFNGYLGMEITVSSAPLTLTKLGRMFVIGNSGSHLLKVIRRSDLTEIPGASATVSMAGGTVGEFQYASLSSPIILSANTGYYIVSQETDGGDAWYDVERTTVTSSGVATVDGGVFGAPWATGGLTNHCYVPVNIKYLTSGAAAPSVALASPTNNASFVVGTNIVLDATVSDNVSGVEFFAGATSLGTASSSPFRVTWTNPLAGNYVLSATALATNGLKTTSAVVNVSIITNTPVIAPTVAISAPANSAIVTSPTNLTLQATASAGVTLVAFYDGTTKIGEATLSPFSVTWNAPAVGTHALTARATGAASLMATSAVVNVTVQLPQTPTVTLVSPIEGASYITPTNVPLQVTVTGATLVEYYAGATKVAQANTSPFSASWANPVAGIYSLTARATGAGGLMATSGVVHITVTTNSPGIETAWVLTKTLGTIRSNFNGFLGVKFTTGPSPVTVSALGRLFSAGNSRTHIVKLVRVSDGVDVQNGSILLSMAGGTVGEFKYGALTTPVMLEANTAYYLASEEVFLMDTWYELDTTITTTTAAAVNGAGYSGSGFPWTGASSAGHTYGPLDFKYLVGAGPQTTATITSPSSGATVKVPTNITITTAVSAAVTNVDFYVGTTKIGSDSTSPFTAVWSNPDPGSYALTVRAFGNNGINVTSSVVNVTVEINVSGTETAFVSLTSAGNARNDFNGFLGMELTTGPNPVTVTKLGRLFTSGNSGTHLVKLVRASDNSDVPGSAVQVSMAGGVAGEFKYQALGAPILLPASTRYFLVSQETLGGDQWRDVQGTVVVPTSVASVDGGVFGGPPWNTGGLSNHCYIAVSFKYLATGGPAAQPRLVAGPAAGQFRLFGEAGKSYAVEACDNLTAWTSIGNVTLVTDNLLVQDPNSGSSLRRFYRVRLVP